MLDALAVELQCLCVSMIMNDSDACMMMVRRRSGVMTTKASHLQHLGRDIHKHILIHA